MVKNGRYALRVVSVRVRVEEPLGQTFAHPDTVKPILQAYFKSIRDDRERVVALMLNCRHALLGITEVSLGGVVLTIVDPKVLFRTLLARGATAFIIAHNHPSGDPTPSQEDLEMTKRIVAGAEVLGLRCLDHFIIGDGTGRIISLLETGQL